MSARAFAVGLTGGIGTGKSLALDAFRAAGADVLSLDAVARNLARRGRPGQRAIVRALGRRVLDARGNIDRKALGERVFADWRLRRRLERAAHPSILREMRRFLARRRRGFAVVDVPLLFEAGLAGRFDATVFVDAPRFAQLSRVMARDGLTRAQALRRARAQWPAARKRALADVVISNDGPAHDLRRAVRGYSRAFALMAAGGGSPR